MKNLILIAMVSLGVVACTKNNKRPVVQNEPAYLPDSKYPCIGSNNHALEFNKIGHGYIPSSFTKEYSKNDHLLFMNEESWLQFVLNQNIVVQDGQNVTVDFNKYQVLAVLDNYMIEGTIWNVADILEYGKDIFLFIDAEQPDNIDLYDEQYRKYDRDFVLIQIPRTDKRIVVASCEIKP